MNKNSILGTGFYKGFELGIVFICDPGYIEFCINSIGSFHIVDLNDLIQAGVINGELDWKYRGRMSAREVPNISDFTTYQEAKESGVLNKSRYVFSHETIQKNAFKLEGNRGGINRGYSNDNYEQEPPYGKYVGSYAQDVEGWSDQDIDDAFNGEPDAYWNID